MSAADDILKTIQGNRKSKPTVEETLSRLIINKGRRLLLASAVTAAFLLMLFVVAADLNISKPWVLTAIPVVIIGMLLCLIPPTEAWEYKPWQREYRKYEKIVAE